MTEASFIERWRAKTEPSFLWQDIKWGIVAALLAVWGVSVVGTAEGAGNQIASYLLIFGGLAWAVYLVRRALARRALATHPIGMALAAMGELGAVKAAVDADFAGRAIDDLPLQVGAKFVCFARKGRVMALPLHHLMWAYHEVVTHKLNGMIPYRKSHQFVVWMRTGDAEVLPIAKRQAEDCLRKLAAAAPWLPVGYNNVLKESWNADRADFIAMVDAGRERAAHAA